MSNATVRRLITRALVSAVIFVAQANTITQVNGNAATRAARTILRTPARKRSAPPLLSGLARRRRRRHRRAWATHADLMRNSAGAFDVR